MDVVVGGAQKKIFVPYGSKLQVSSEGASTSVYYSSLPSSGIIENWIFQERFSDSGKEYGPFASDKNILVVVSGAGKALCEVGVSPNLVFRYPDKIGIGVPSPTQSLDIVGNIELTGVVDGGGAVSQVIDVTNGSGSPYQASAIQSGAIFTNSGALAKAYIDLPASSDGVIFTFYVKESVGIRITADSGDYISLGGQLSASGGYVEATDVGSQITLKCIDNEWTSFGGIWSVN